VSIIESYQQEQALEQPKPEAARLATVEVVWSDGLQLKFDGEEQSDGKSYLCNNGIKYQSGDRVLVQKVGGSYIVVCRVGRPNNTDEMVDKAKMAYYVWNNASGKAYLEFYTDTNGILWVRNCMNASNKWTKLTGEVGTPPGPINRPVEPY